MAKVMMIASGKGGTGKSTVAVFMATELALDGNRTLLIELDAGLRSVDVISGTGRQAVYDISDVLKGRCEPQKAILTSPHTDKLHIIAAPYKSSDTDFTGFKQMTDSLYEDYDYILIDTAAGLGNAFYAACEAATLGIIVATADVISVRDGRLVSDEMYDAGLRDIRLIINKFSRDTFKYSGFEDLDRIIDGVCARLLGVIPASAAISKCAINGSLLAPLSPERQIFRAICRRIQGQDVQVII